MFAKSFIVSALLACGALAAPTSSVANELEKRSRSGDATDLPDGRCEAHIYIESKRSILHNTTSNYQELTTVTQRTQSS